MTKSNKILILIVFLLLLFTVIFLQFNKVTSKSVDKVDSNDEDKFVPFQGVVNIEIDRSSSNSDAKGNTGLDGMSIQEVSDFRLSKISKYQQLGFFHDKYDPLKFHHQRVYNQITPGKKWQGPVPYYIENPYILIVFTLANRVTPLNLYFPGSEIVYENGRIVETISGKTVPYFFRYIFHSYQHSGKIWPIMANAWDAGFYFIHVDISRSKNIVFNDQPGHITNSIHSRKYFYHVGRYGTNNLSPTDRTAWLELKEKNTDTVVFIKLWKSKPDSVKENSDLNYIFKLVVPNQNK